MANFCANCGSPLGANSAFCLKCGAAAPNRATPVASAPAAPPSAPAWTAPAGPTAKGGSGLKIVAIIIGCLFLGGAAVVGGLIYVAHRVKQAVVQKAAENGVDLNSISHSASSDSQAKRRLPQPCELLTKEDVSRLIGEPIQRTEVQDKMCMYYGPPGLNAKLAQEQASGAFKRAEAPGAQVNGTEMTNAMDQMINSVAAQAGQTGSGGELPLLMLGVDADGKAQMTAMTATKAIFSGIGRDAYGKGGFGADVPGLGDRAVRLPKLGLNVLQGEIIIRVIPGPFPDSDAKTIAVVRAVLPKI